MKISLQKFSLILTLFVGIQFSSSAQNWDVNLLRDINHSYTPAGGSTMTFFSESVTPVAIAVPISIWGYALIKKDKQQAYNGLMVASSEVINSMITVSMKLGFKRERPFNAYPNDIIKHSSGGSYSFPSGHTSMAFNVATALTLNYPRWYVYIPAYVWASGVGYSRMYLGVHYPSDVLVGAIVGSGAAILTHYGRKYLVERKKKKVESAQF
jgi:membrane-associated phospholipid phosphatase